MSEDEKQRLVKTIKENLGVVDDENIKILETKQFYQADPDYGIRVAKALGLNLEDIK